MANIMKLLVTGGLGFIGSNLCHYIIANHPDYEIINIDKIGIGANPASLKDLEKERRYRFVKGDICDSNIVDRLIRQVDAVINVAAETHVDRSIANPAEYIQNNTVGTFTVLEAVRKYNRNTRLVQVSTDEVYGEIPEGSFTEKDAPKPGSPYSAAKASADMFVQAYHKTYNLDVSITRCTNNFGPYQFPEKLIPKTIIRAIKNLSVPIYGTGKNIRDWLYVQDHCRAIDCVLTKGKSGEIYNVSSGKEITNIEIVQKILKHLGKDRDLIAFVEDRPGHDIRYSLDSSRIRSELGWKPEHSFEEALRETIDWYVHNEAWWKPLATEETLNPTPWKQK
jgi:dTDP-glucose 4,6-dehydratase